MNTLQPAMDRAAIGFSMICAIHCAFMPVALTLVPAFASTPLGDESFHKLMILGVLPTSILALFIGCRKHRSRMVIALGATGLTLLVGAAFFGHDLLGETGEKIATLVGAITISIGHIQNQRLCAAGDCEDCRK